MYDLHSNKEVISNICQLETLILEKYSNSTSNISKIPVYNLSNQLKSCSIKLFSDIDKRTQECKLPHCPPLCPPNLLQTNGIVATIVYVVDPMLCPCVAAKGLRIFERLPAPINLPPSWMVLHRFEHAVG